MIFLVLFILIILGHFCQSNCNPLSKRDVSSKCTSKASKIPRNHCRNHLLFLSKRLHKSKKVQKLLLSSFWYFVFLCIKSALECNFSSLANSCRLCTAAPNLVHRLFEVLRLWKCSMLSTLRTLFYITLSAVISRTLNIANWKELV